MFLKLDAALKHRHTSIHRLPLFSSFCVSILRVSASLQCLFPIASLLDLLSFTMRFATISLLLASIPSLSSASPTNNVISSRQNVNLKVNKHLRPVLEKRQEFDQGEPINAKGNGAPILGKSQPLFKQIYRSRLTGFQGEQTSR